MKLAPALARNFKAKNLRFVVIDFRWQADGRLVLLCKIMCEGVPEEGAVEVQFLQRNVDLLALGAKNFDASFA